jgi:hypothetical protein
MTSGQKKILIISSAVSIVLGGVVLSIILLKNRKKDKLSVKKLQAIAKSDLNNWKDITETDRRGAEILQVWWKWLGYDYSLSDLMSATWQKSHYWSAVYISSVMKRWGLGDKFTYSPRHAKFIVDGKEALKNKDTSRAFWSYRPDQVPLAVGDILAKPRTSGLNYDNLFDKAKTHTDVVYAMKKTDTGYKAYLIGGNLSQKVKTFAVELDKKKMLKNPGSYLAIMKNRLM